MGRRGRGLKKLGVACAIAATAIGLLYLHVGDAPRHYLLINAAALLLGIAALLALDRLGPQRDRVRGAAILVGGVVLLVVAFFGQSVEGATRWIRVGPISLQPAAILVPAMVVAYAKRQDAVGTLGMIVAAVGVALQPDRAMAGALAAGLLVVALTTRSRAAFVALAAALVGFASTMLRPDRVAPSPFVERVFASAFELGVAMGIFVLLGTALLLVPAVVGAKRDPTRRRAYVAFCATWLVIVVAAALGNYPTPLVGYGSSALLGYLVSVAVLPDGLARTER